jgi:VanZ family protein
MRWAPVYLWGAFLLFCTSIPSPPQPGFLPYADKLFHFTGYLILALLACRAKRGVDKRVFLYCALFAAADEVHQSFIPYRNSSLIDFSMNLLGLIIGFLFWRRLSLRLQPKQE